MVDISMSSPYNLTSPRQFHSFSPTPPSLQARTLPNQENKEGKALKELSEDHSRSLLAKKPAKKPPTKKHVAKKPPTKKPVAKKPPSKKPVAKKPPTKKSVAKKPPAKKPVAKKPKKVNKKTKKRVKEKVQDSKVKVFKRYSGMDFGEYDYEYDYDYDYEYQDPGCWHHPPDEYEYNEYAYIEYKD